MFGSKGYCLRLLVVFGASAMRSLTGEHCGEAEEQQLHEALKAKNKAVLMIGDLHLDLDSTCFASLFAFGFL